MATKPEFVIFYAWQSDCPGGHNRYFIQEVAARVAEKLNGDPACPYRIRIDQDAQGVPGLCDIPATILQKITSADAFLCDLTYIATTTRSEKDNEEDFRPRYCSNPNVLFELGFAFRAIGWERLLLVMNEHYGLAKEQIFDLAHRRHPMTYRYPAEGVSKRQAADGLAGELVDLP